MVGGWLLPVALIAVFAAVVGVVALRKRRRRQALVRTAQQLGLHYSNGDPLGLGRSLGADVYETIWGHFDGADVAVATASRPVSRPDREAWETSSVGVSLKIKVVRGLEVAQQAAGPTALVGLMNDGRLAVRPRVPQQRLPRQRSKPPVVDADDLPDLLHATARAARSQYW